MRGWWAMLLVVAMGASCTRYNAEFCCLTLDSCEPFDVDEIRQCEAGLVCVDNRCASAGDGMPADGAPDPACLAAGGQIVFQTDRDGDTEIARILADGTGFQQLTNNEWPDELPQISPDGLQIAWLASPSGARELFVMSLDGSDAREVSAGDVYMDGAMTFRWSPDSRDILFAANRSESREIYVASVAAGRSAPVNVTNHPDVDYRGDWSPDGARIVFYTQRDLEDGALPIFGSIYVMDADGAAPMDMTGVELVAQPRWAPSATRVAYAKTVDTHSDLYLHAVTGGSQPLGIGPAADYVWSPDSSALAFVAAGDVLAVQTNGSGVENLTLGAGSNRSPTWSPDSTKIAFDSDREGQAEIYVVDATGGPATNLTNAPGDDRVPAWGRCP